MIYLDNHTATPPCRSALEPFAETYWSSSLISPHLVHEKIRAIQEFVNAEKFIFTSSGAEAVNQVFWSIFLEVARKEGKTHIIISEIEDAPTLRSAKRLEELGCTIKVVPTVNGIIDLDALSQLINPRTALISVTMAHGLTGVIQPTDQILALAREKNVWVHFDANYAMGKFPFQADADYITFSGDLIHSIKGSGGIFLKDKAPIAPLVLGGGKGDVNVPSLMALHGAMQQSYLYLDTLALEGVRLRDLFEASIAGKVLYQDAFRLPNTSMISFPNVHNEALLYYLTRKGVHATIGGDYAPKIQDQTALSFSLSRMTTEEELMRASQIINETVSQLQKLSEVFV